MSSVKTLGFKSKIDMNLAGVFYAVIEDDTVAGKPIFSRITKNLANPAELSILYAATRMTIHRLTV